MALLNDVRKAQTDLRIPRPEVATDGPGGTTGVTKRLSEEQSQCINICATVHRLRYRLALTHSLQGRLLLRCHPTWRSPEPIGNTLPRFNWLAS